MEIITMPHNELYNTILTTYSGKIQEKSYDVFMYDMPWLSFPGRRRKFLERHFLTKLKEMDLELIFPGSSEVL